MSKNPKSKRRPTRPKKVKAVKKHFCAGTRM
jgi:hypothetical protein